MDKLHWFSFSYSGKSLSCDRNCEASTYTGYKDKNITLNKIQRNKEYIGVDSSAALISVCYLGFMTKNEFEFDGDL